MNETTNTYPKLNDQAKFRLNEINKIKNIKTILIQKFKKEK